MEGVPGECFFAAAWFPVDVQAGKVLVEVYPVVLVDGGVPVNEQRPEEPDDSLPHLGLHCFRMVCASESVYGLEVLFQIF